MATITVVNDDRPSSGWIIAFILLCFIFLNRECNKVPSKDAGLKHKSASNTQLEISNFQANAVHFNGRRVKMGPCLTYQCKPNDTKAWITDEVNSDFVLAVSNTGFPGEESAFFVEGTPILKRIDNKKVWVLTDVKVIPI